MLLSFHGASVCLSRSPIFTPLLPSLSAVEEERFWSSPPFSLESIPVEWFSRPVYATLGSSPLYAAAFPVTGPTGYPQGYPSKHTALPLARIRTPTLAEINMYALLRHLGL